MSGSTQLVGMKRACAADGAKKKTSSFIFHPLAALLLHRAMEEETKASAAASAGGGGGGAANAAPAAPAETAPGKRVRAATPAAVLPPPRPCPGPAAHPVPHCFTRPTLPPARCLRPCAPYLPPSPRCAAAV
jgi:hypothetical protein